MWKPLLAAAGGAAVGFLFAKLRYEKAANLYAIERIEQAKVYAEERAEREIARVRAEAEAEAVDAVAAVYEENPEKITDVINAGEEEVLTELLTNYSGFSNRVPENVVEEDSESHIVLIRRKEFFEGPLSDDYHQTSLTYYQLDHVLIDENDKQLDVHAAIGSIRPDWFGNEPDNEHVCYVRNTNIKIEFEVERSLGSYTRDVLGLGGDEDEDEG